MNTQELKIERRTDKSGEKLLLLSSWFEKIKNYLPVILASLLLLLLGQILNKGFASPGNINNLIASASILALAALGQTLIIISGNEGIDLSVGAMMSMGAVIGATISNSTSMGIGLAVIILIAIGAFIGLINGIAIQTLSVPPLVMTMAMTTVVNGLTVAVTRGKFSGMATPFLQEIGTGHLFHIRWLIIIGIVCLILVELFLRKSRHGKSLYLVGSNPNAAILAGLKSYKVVLRTYIIAGITGSLCGLILLSNTGMAQMGMGKDYTLLSVAAVVIGGTSLAGGKGTFIGSFLGAIMLVVLTTVFVAVGMNPGVRELIQGLLLMVILIIYSKLT